MNNKLPTFDLFGIQLHALSKHELVDAVAQAITSSGRCIIANHNLHSLYMWLHEPRMREFYCLADYTHIDGMSLVLLGRLLGMPLKREHRTGYIDLLPLLARKAAENGWRIFYLGSKPGVAEEAVRNLRQQYRGLQILAHHGYFDARAQEVENLAILAQINAYQPDILMVGMGMPRQELWILENQQSISAHAVLCCGGLMDLVAGEIPTCPRWIGFVGFEWFYRLLSEPLRLWKRYLVEPWSVMGSFMRLHLGSTLLRTNAGANRND